MELKTCPFCGSVKLIIRQGVTFNWAQVVCGKCGSSGERRNSTELAHDSWNTRVTDVIISRKYHALMKVKQWMEADNYGLPPLSRAASSVYNEVKNALEGQI